MREGALDGIRILDLTTVVMGPYAAVTLGDLGADVIKVEPTAGDSHRFAGSAVHDGMSAPAMNLHRNKRSIALDLATDDGRQVFSTLVSTADVLLTNLRPKSRARLGLDYLQLSEENPRIILLTSQGWGSDSPRGDDPAYDDIIQAASGTAHLSEASTGSPRYAPYAIADKVVGLNICIATLAALIHRSSTGRGQHVDVPMVDSMVAFNLVEHFNGHTFDPHRGDFGWQRILEPERVPQRTSDGWVCIMPYSDRNWTDMFRIAEMTDFIGDERYLDINYRNTHMGELMVGLRKVTPTRTTDDWLTLCQTNGIPAAPILDLAEAEKDSYLHDRGVLTLREHPTEGQYWSTTTPFSMSDSPVRFRSHAPHIGADTDMILRELGYDESQIEQLVDKHVVRTNASAEKETA